MYLSHIVCLLGQSLTSKSTLLWSQINKSIIHITERKHFLTSIVDFFTIKAINCPFIQYAEATNMVK